MAKVLQVRELVGVQKHDAGDNPMTHVVNGKDEPVMIQEPRWHTIGAAREDGHRLRVELAEGGYRAWQKHGAADHLTQLENGELVVQATSVTNSDKLRLVDDE